MKKKEVKPIKQPIIIDTGDDAVCSLFTIQESPSLSRIIIKQRDALNGGNPNRIVFSKKLIFDVISALRELK